MSFEGYYQIVCGNGHRYNTDLFGEEERTKCPICNSSAKWWNLVDVTNGSFDDDGIRIDGGIKLEVKKAAKTCKCERCGNEHIVETETYVIPNGKGHVV